MDSLYSGLKALEGQYKGKNSKGKYLEAEELPVPVVRMEKDMFVLVDDVLSLLERAAVEPLPPKDEKGPQNRTKDGSLGEEFNKDSIECDERRLTELGRRTIEIFILAHVFSKIEVAYQEAIALKKHEELIREEDVAWLAETEHKARLGAVDKEKKSKKKQGKQKRNNQKTKDKGRDDKAGGIAQDKIEEATLIVNRKDLLPAKQEMVFGKSGPLEDVSDLSDYVECVSKILPLDSEDREVSPVNWDTDNSGVHPPTETSSSGINGLSTVQNGTEGRSSYVVDDSSSTCSSDSVPSAAISVPQIGNSRCQKNKKLPNRGRNHKNNMTPDPADWDSEQPSQPSQDVRDAGNQVVGSQSSKSSEARSEAAHHTFQVMVVNGAERHVAKEEETNTVHRRYGVKDANVEFSRDTTACLPRSPCKKIPSVAPPKSESKVVVLSDLIVKSQSCHSPRQADRSVNREYSAENALKFATPKPTEKPPLQPVKVTTEKPLTPSVPTVSRPLSAPTFPGPMPLISVVPSIPMGPTLAHSVSVVGRLGPKPSTASASPSYVPQSYRNAIMGPASPPSYATNHSASSVVNASYSYSQAPALVSTPLFSPYASDRMESHQIRAGFSFGMASHRDTLQNAPLWEPSRNSTSDRASLLNGMQSFDQYSSIPASMCIRQSHALPEEFPHLDIINDLLDDEHGGDRSFSNGPHYLNRHFSFPGNPSISGGLGPATSTCRFERAKSYQDDGFQHIERDKSYQDDGFQHCPGLDYFVPFCPMFTTQYTPDCSITGPATI